MGAFDSSEFARTGCYGLLVHYETYSTMRSTIYYYYNYIPVQCSCPCCDQLATSATMIRRSDYTAAALGAFEEPTPMSRAQTDHTTTTGGSCALSCAIC